MWKKLLFFLSAAFAELTPEQFHIALGSNPSDMNIAWTTQIGQYIGNK